MLTARACNLITLKHICLLSRILLEKLTVSQLIKKLAAFHGTWSFLLPCLQEPTTAPVLSQMNPVHNFSKTFLLLSSSMKESPGVFLQVFLPKFRMHLSFLSRIILIFPLPSYPPWFYHPNNISHPALLFWISLIGKYVATCATHIWRTRIQHICRDTFSFSIDEIIQRSA